MSPQEVKSKAVSAVKALGIRTLITLLIRIGSSLIMARLLFANDYGAFAVAAWILGMGTFLSDVGLAGALVRQHTKPTRDEEFTVFISQQVIAAVIVVLVITVGPALAGVSNMAASQRGILYVMALNLFNNSLRVIPLMALERELKFKTIAKIELTQSVVNTALNIFLAWLGWGAWALAIGSVAGATATTVGVWIASPWKPGGVYRFGIVKRLAKFGIAFQLNALMPTLLSGWIPILVGKLLGLTAVGFVNWANSLASVPMMLSAVLNRVAFPAYARLQDHPETLGNYVKTAARRLMALMTLVVPLGVLACPVAIPVLFKARWAPAIPLVQWFSIDVMLGTLLGVLASVQNATGFAADRLWVATATGLARWGVGFLAIRWFGIAGVGPTVVLITLTELMSTTWLIQVRNGKSAGLMTAVLSPVLRIALMIGAAWGLSQLVPGVHPYVQSFISVGCFVTLLVVTEVLTRGRMVTEELMAIVRMVRK